VPTREQAHAAIADGLVLVSGAPADKAARLVGAGEPIRLVGPPRRFVSRGGDKLEAALAEFEIAVDGCRVLDAGSSTGGFVDCVLSRGAVLVYAVDVGHGQIDQRLRGDRRVAVFERLNVRTLRPSDLDGPERPFEPVDVVTADLSFISLCSVTPALVALCRPGGELALLVKPQFEVGRVEASRGRGIVRDPEQWRRVLAEVCSALGAAGTGIMGAMPSPLRGSSGNVEFFLHARVGATQAVDPGVLVDGALARVEAG
jgi:23S rRNA (cytidine1920-2'-O)/16S rRNA (cytidine1409-2'-O)-methyltransferase